jgi:hypothetical protein
MFMSGEKPIDRVRDRLVVRSYKDENKRFGVEHKKESFGDSVSSRIITKNI